MTTLPRFIQIHTLHNYPAALLNRDDAGLAKRLPYGNAVRTRISSQCLKRHWRMADDIFSLSSLGVPMAIRSRGFAEKILETLVKDGVAEDIATSIAAALRDGFKKDLKKLIKAATIPKKAKGKKGASDVDEAEEDGVAENADQKQAILLGVSEFAYLTKMAREVATQVVQPAGARLAMLKRLESEQENLKAMKHGSGLEAALFGRMVTSDVLTNRDASVYVAHAFTVHKEQVENDYFTVVDDLLRESGEQGSAGIFDTELASGLYYGYVVVDVPQLVANLEGVKIEDCFKVGADRRELAAKVVHHLLHLIATVSPGAKRGSTAPFEWAKLMLVEAGDWQPRSLAGAFQNKLDMKQGDIRERAVGRLSDELQRLDAAYGAPSERRFLSVDDMQVPGAERLPLASLTQWVQDRIVSGEEKGA
jgi:CRISPR system Cascade subunit CasC